MSLTNYTTWSFLDIVEHVLDVFLDGDRAKHSRRMARRAVLDAYEDLGNARNWTYLYRRFLIATVAQQNTGSIAYDHTGGSAERLVTLTDATWPEDVIYYELIVGNVRYEIERRVSDTEITLTEQANPGADVAAGTAYTLVKAAFPLPHTFQSRVGLVDANSRGRRLEYVAPAEFQQLSNIVRTTAMPWKYTIVGNPRLSSGLVLMFSPSPTEARTYDLWARFKPLPLKVEKYATGTVTLAAGSTTATGVGTAFTDDHAGCLLRVSRDNDNLPTSLIGSLDDIDNQAAFEGVVRRRISATSLELEQAAPAALGPCKFILSSRLDIEAGSMLNYFKRLVEANYAEREGLEGAASRRKAAERAFGEAAAADDRDPNPEQPYYYGPYSLEDLAISVNP